MNTVSPAWRQALSGKPLRSATFWALFLLLGLILESAASLMIRIMAIPMRDMLDITPIVILAFVLGFVGYGFWLVVQTYQEARAAVATEHEEILARYSYLTVRMYFIAGGCTLLCLRVAEWLMVR